MKGKPPVLLLVENDEAHAILIMRSFEDIKLGNKVYWVSDGEEALGYLFRHGKYADKEKSPRPDLILLVKPVDFGEFSEMIRDLGHYWLVLNQKPNI